MLFNVLKFVIILCFGKLMFLASEELIVNKLTGRLYFLDLYFVSWDSIISFGRNLPVGKDINSTKHS